MLFLSGIDPLHSVLTVVCLSVESEPAEVPALCFIQEVVLLVLDSNFFKKVSLFQGRLEHTKQDFFLDSSLIQKNTVFAPLDGAKELHGRCTKQRQRTQHRGPRGPTAPALWERRDRRTRHRLMAPAAGYNSGCRKAGNNELTPPARRVRLFRDTSLN